MVGPDVSTTVLDPHFVSECLLNAVGVYLDESISASPEFGAGCRDLHARTIICIDLGNVPTGLDDGVLWGSLSQRNFDLESRHWRSPVDPR